jgi:hypothetical protein
MVVLLEWVRMVQCWRRVAIDFVIMLSAKDGSRRLVYCHVTNGSRVRGNVSAGVSRA